jgi:hypothetical protein
VVWCSRAMWCRWIVVQEDWRVQGGGQGSRTELHFVVQIAQWINGLRISKTFQTAKSHERVAGEVSNWISWRLPCRVLAVHGCSECQEL